MTRLAIAFASVCLATPLAAQSVITLDDFDLGDSSVETQPVAREAESSMALCLRDPSACDDGKFKSKVNFTVDDVVNIGIIDREEVDETQVSTSGLGQTEPQALPSIDLEVLFDSNSDAIRADQFPQLIELSEVLRTGDFGSYRLIFMGHTDAKGSAAYNLDLSKRRAESVATFVAASAGLPRSAIQSVGLGFTRLADPTNPLGEVNRRVQLVLVPLS